MKHILLVEDDKDYAKVVATILQEEGYFVDVRNTPLQAIEAAKEIKYDLMIADLDLGTLSGVHVAEIVRRDNPLLPIMILTGSNKEEDELRVLSTGINDYVQKSVTFNVLLGRVRHIFEMQKLPESYEPILVSQVEGITVKLEDREVLKNDQVVELTMLEYELLCYFLKNKNKILSREEILQRVWKLTDKDGVVDLRVVDSFVKNIRQKLSINAIHSIRGVGYRWHE